MSHGGVLAFPGRPSCWGGGSVYWKFRVGDYRLIAEIIDDRVIVLMLVVAHRREVYKTAKKRLSEE
ncbi:MAG: type II toxin-antitoxin system RelE/ParE family toxin [Spirochaetaceae bacterium]|nr:type II toxin-antitoxin system RelE/ParE family toxin [Spirochaetaceae bacterium]